ncbi:hypothetical protein ABPG72_016820 [Tetrahymena utriculariae]
MYCSNKNIMQDLIYCSPEFVKFLNNQAISKIIGKGIYKQQKINYCNLNIYNLSSTPWLFQIHKNILITLNSLILITYCILNIKCFTFPTSQNNIKIHKPNLFVYGFDLQMFPKQL